MTWRYWTTGAARRTRLWWSRRSAESARARSHGSGHRSEQQKACRDWLGRLWWSFYDNSEPISSVLRELVAYTSGRPHQQIARLNQAELTDQALTALHSRPYLVVLDGFERLLPPTAGLSQLCWMTSLESRIPERWPIHWQWCSCPGSLLPLRRRSLLLLG